MTKRIKCFSEVKEKEQGNEFIVDSKPNIISEFQQACLSAVTGAKTSLQRIKEQPRFKIVGDLLVHQPLKGFRDEAKQRNRAEDTQTGRRADFI